MNPFLFFFFLSMLVPHLYLLSLSSRFDILQGYVPVQRDREAAILYVPKCVSWFSLNRTNKCFTWPANAFLYFHVHSICLKLSEISGINLFITVWYGFGVNVILLSPFAHATDILDNVQYFFKLHAGQQAVSAVRMQWLPPVHLQEAVTGSVLAENARPVDKGERHLNGGSQPWWFTCEWIVIGT